MAVNTTTSMKQRSKKYQEASRHVDANKVYAPAEAMGLVKKTSTTAFDATVELHIHLGIDPSKSEQFVRGTIVLPHSTGSTKRIAVFAVAKEAEAREAGADIVGGPQLIEEIKTTGKINFDVAVAEPALMKDLAKIAKILGPKGLMPSPKNETVTEHIAKVVAELKRGKATFKNDDTGNIHVTIGKVSMAPAQLTENFSTLMDAVKRAKPSAAKGTFIESVTIATTMGPGIRVAV